MKKYARFLVLGLVVLVAVGVVGFNLFRDKMIAQFFDTMQPPPQTVSATAAARGGWRPEIEAIGTARAAQGVEIATQIGGVIEAVGFEPNARVTKGQLLVRIDSAVERAELRAAEAELELAQSQLRRQTELRQKGVAAQASLDEAASRLGKARADADRLRAILERKEIKAPFDGVVGIPRIDVGAYVQPGTAIVSLQDLDRMQVDFTVSEQGAARLAVGQEMMFRGRDGGSDLTGRIVGIDPRVDPTTRLVTVRAEMIDAAGKVRPGEFVRANVLLPAEENIIALPQTAVVNSLYGDYVYRLDKGEKDALVARQVFVKVGRRSGMMIEVVEGIEPGQTIVTSGQNKLFNGGVAVVDNTVDPTKLAAAAPGVTQR
ncbi:MAG TPA: efflux RND transporter periplasmic adaptor subunit [Azospirillaceae bacterium]|nr:efflux RND transporter periplasmic adaptor subunit [Azospirillaceae bacterium]